MFSRVDRRLTDRSRARFDAETGVKVVEQIGVSNDGMVTEEDVDGV